MSDAGDAPAPVDAVLWDFGGVFTPSPFAAAHAYAAAQGADPDAFVRVVFGPYDADTDHPWHRLERGELPIADALAGIAEEAAAAGVRFDAQELFLSMADDGVDRTIVVEHVRIVRARGLRTAIVTNNVREYGRAWRDRLGAEELFDLIVDSSEEGVRKPDPVIYRIALERLGVSDPARAVFLDDFEHNVTIARSLGMHGIVVGPDPRPALDALAELLGTPIA